MQDLGHTRKGTWPTLASAIYNQFAVEFKSFIPCCSDFTIPPAFDNLDELGIRCPLPVIGPYIIVSHLKRSLILSFVVI